MAISLPHFEDYKDRIVYFLTTRINGLKEAELNLSRIHGDNLRLTILDDAVLKAWQSQWNPILQSNPALKKRYYGTWTYDLEGKVQPKDEAGIISRCYTFRDADFSMLQSGAEKRSAVSPRAVIRKNIKEAWFPFN